MYVINLQPEESKSLNWMAWNKFMVCENSSLRAREKSRIRRQKVYSQFSNSSYASSPAESSLPDLVVSPRTEKHRAEDKEISDVLKSGAIREFLKNSGNSLQSAKPVRGIYTNKAANIVNAARKELDFHPKRGGLTPTHIKVSLKSIYKTKQTPTPVLPKMNAHKIYSTVFRD